MIQASYLNLIQGSRVKKLKCYFCGKTPMFGNNVSHSKRHTKRMFMPNIHPTTLMVDGKPKRLKVCTRCLRTHYKAARKETPSPS
ncbi:MAG: 50S ribosomal protein L28 [Dehalococcoidales bacterium]|nr:50S ribosomal protein L28 [Dehalococcoidales bacterium]MDP6501825.1 50S ribosomal protein L28 [Dehalococcoidales bacterium]MDP6633124.1 50S ribosomal protein L28 [Dehalococcoidales bacterium]